MERKKILIEIPKLQGNAYTGSFRFMDTSPKPVSSQAQTVFCHGNCWKNPVPPVSEDEQAIWTRKIFNFPPRVMSDAGQNSLWCTLTSPAFCMTGVLRPCRPNTWTDLGSTSSGVGETGWTPAPTPSTAVLVSGSGALCLKSVPH